MAVTIQTKRSTGTSAPGTLSAGELAVTYGSGTQGNNGERLFVGNNDGSSVIVIGGKYFSDKLLRLKKNSIVVGHSNTTPVLSGLLIDESLEPFSEDIYNRIYKVEINEDKKKLIIINTDFQCK